MAALAVKALAFFLLAFVGGSEAQPVDAWDRNEPFKLTQEAIDKHVTLVEKVKLKVPESVPEGTKLVELNYDESKACLVCVCTNFIHTGTSGPIKVYKNVCRVNWTHQPKPWFASTYMSSLGYGNVNSMECNFISESTGKLLNYTSPLDYEQDYTVSFKAKFGPLT